MSKHCKTYRLLMTVEGKLYDANAPY